MDDDAWVELSTAQRSDLPCGCRVGGTVVEVAVVGAVHETIPFDELENESRQRNRLGESMALCTRAARNTATQPTQLTFPNQLGGCDSGCRAVEWQLWITLTGGGAPPRYREPCKARDGERLPSRRPSSLCGSIR